MKNQFLISLSAFMFPISAFAFIPSASITTMSLKVYGIYTSADPTCATGMVATIPLTSTPQTLNFAQTPTIGSGAISETIGCVVIAIANNLSNGWAAGTYSSTSSGHSDNVCNAGGSNTGQAICGNGGSQTVSWPQKVITDAAAVGLTLASGSCNGVTTEVVPLILSTNSACTGNQIADAGVSVCSGGNNNNFNIPTSAGDVHNGTKLTAPSVAGNLKFIVNPSNTLGSDGSSCGNLAAPLFSFAAD